MKSVKIVLAIIFVFVIIGAASFALKICPPSGPWPSPPWCSGEGSKLVLPVGVTEFDLSRPQYTGSRSAFAFPPSCTLIPDKIGQSICEDYKSGSIIFWQEEACDALPFESGKEMCKKERGELKKIGDKNAVSLRKEKGEWWKRPDLNVYVYGDTRLRTEELRPDVSVWGGGSHDGWRDDEIFMTHAAGVLKIVSHSFGYIGGNDLDYMRNALIKEEGIAITGPEDLKKPEVVKIKTDLEYLKSKSLIFKKIIPAISKNFDSVDAVVDFTFPDGSKKISSIFLSPIVPEFKNYLIQYYKWQVDAGADGMFMDDIGGSDPAKSFNSIVLQKFSEWLVKNADKAMLAKYNIKDAADFNYQEFLKRAGYTRTTIDNTVGKTIGASNAWRDIPLMFEFRKFLIEENQKALTDIVNQVKAYAKEKGNKNFIVTGNTGELAPAGAFAVPLFDYLTFEHGYLRDTNPFSYNSVMGITHLAEAKNRPVANQIIVTNWTPLAENTNKELKLNIMKLAIMESYAAGSGTSYVRYSLNDPRAKSNDMTTVYQAMEDRFDLQGVQKAYGFMRKNLATFRDFTRSTAKVAVILDNDEIIKEWKEKITADHQYSVENIGKSLESAGIAYDVINPQQLNDRIASKQYKYVILPKFGVISGELNTVIAKARESGSKVIEVTSNESAVASQVKNDISVLKLPAKMKAVVKANEKGNFVVHLLNYDYDANGFKERKDIPIDASFFGTAKKITFSSLEQTAPIELDIKNPVVPAVATYGMLLIEK